MYSVTSLDYTARSSKKGGMHYHGVFDTLAEAEREIAKVKKKYNNEGNYSKYKINVHSTNTVLPSGVY